MDLGAHLVDATHYLLGRVRQVRADMRTFIGERFTSKKGDQKENVDVDDWALAKLELSNAWWACSRSHAWLPERAGHPDSKFTASQGALNLRRASPSLYVYFNLKRGEWNQCFDQRSSNCRRAAHRTALALTLNTHKARWSIPTLAAHTTAA